MRKPRFRISWAALVVGILAGLLIGSVVWSYIGKQSSVCDSTVFSSTIRQILEGNSTIIHPGYYVDLSARLAPRSTFNVTWNTSDTVYVYVFNSSEFYAFYLTGATLENFGSEKDISTGSLNMTASYSDTYYFVIENLHTGILGAGPENVEVYQAQAILVAPACG